MSSANQMSASAVPNKTYVENWEPDEEFRDHLATVSASGSRIWLYPRETKGAFTNYRRYVGWFLIALWLIGPWLTYDGQPLMMLNVLDRHFIIMGQHFGPQDLMYFGILLLTFFIFIAVFTLTFGRVWCGWACPQTLFMEQIFRRIEYAIEGSARQQMVLAQQPWNFEKIWKKGLKQAIFLAVAFTAGFWAMLYLFGKQDVLAWVGGSLVNETRMPFFLVGFSVLFYGAFAWAREQVCTAMCPYGRLQGVLLNNSSLMVWYNKLRGEPRKVKGTNAPAGDCVDCGLCVQVCPTGIDIRNGSQLECINCTACIDACDNVMTKLGKPTKLIGLTSYDQMTPEKTSWKPTTRVWIASVIMVLLLAIDAYILINRSPMNITILRVPGQMYQRQTKGYIANLYNLQLVNKTTEPVNVELIPPAGARYKLIAGTMQLGPQGHSDLTLFIEIPEGQLKSRRNDIEIQFTSSNGVKTTKKTTFLAP